MNDNIQWMQVNGHGNFGSLDDDPAAAMRYTECRWVVPGAAPSTTRQPDEDTRRGLRALAGSQCHSVFTLSYFLGPAYSWFTPCPPCACFSDTIALLLANLATLAAFDATSHRPHRSSTALPSPFHCLPRLQSLSADMLLADLDADTVDFLPTFDSSQASARCVHMGPARAEGV